MHLKNTLDYTCFNQPDMPSKIEWKQKSLVFPWDKSSPFSPPRLPILFYCWDMTLLWFFLEKYTVFEDHQKRPFLQPYFLIAVLDLKSIFSLVSLNFSRQKSMFAIFGAKYFNETFLGNFHTPLYLRPEYCSSHSHIFWTASCFLWFIEVKGVLRTFSSSSSWPVYVS